MADYYQDAEAPESNDQGPSDEEHEDSGEQTALLPKGILGGKEFKPGEEVVLQIVADHGEEVEVKYASEEGAKGDSAMGKADTELASMGDAQGGGGNY